MTRYTTAPKIAARAENIRLYQELAGLPRIPAGQQYWTLSNRCDSAPTSELAQLVRAGLLAPSQFHGVDNDAELIRLNSIDHPRAHWHCGDWNQVIAQEPDFRPAFIYLDTMHDAGRLALNMAASTMNACPARTVLLLNVCQSSVYRETEDASEFLEDLSSRVPNLDAWVPDGGIRRYVYCSNATLMATYAFWRRQ